MRGWAERRYELSESALDRIDRCLACRACESVCPSGIRMGEMAESFRHEMNRAGRPSGLSASRAGRFLLDRVLPYRERIALLTDLLAAYQRSGLRGPVDRLLSRLAPGLAPALALTPDVPSRHIRRVETERTRPDGWRAEGERCARVALFLGCIAAEWYAPVHRATIRVLTANGCDVVVPDAQTCCGALDRHAGRLDEAERLVRRNLAAFAAVGVDAVVVNAAGCGASLREPLGTVPSGTPPVLDVCAFLHELGMRDPRRSLARRVAYDSPCHLLHAQRVGKSVVEELLRRVPGLELLPLRDEDHCCGAGGVYNLLRPDVADEVLRAKVEAIRETGADTVATGNPGCAMQITKGLRETGIEVVHPVELLDEAYANGPTG
jgi:glycolate oxidase iron-sulfur subunit